jgi:hypothetical protein
MSTTAELMGRVRFSTGQHSEQSQQDEEVLAHLNRGQEFLIWALAVSAMPEMTETATGSLTNSRVALPNDFAFEQLVEVGSTLVTCRPYPVSKLDALEGGITQFTPSTSQPYYYIWYNRTDGADRLHILLGNDSSTAAYSLRYVKKPTDLDLTANDPVWNERANDVLVDFAAMRVMENMGNIAEAQRRWRELILPRIARINGRHRADGKRHETRPSFS